MELTGCPECDQPAEVQWRTVLASTDGPVEHVKILCIDRHSFLLPTPAPGCPSGPGSEAWETGVWW